MYRSMIDIQSTAAEIRRGINKEEEDRRKEKVTTRQKYNGPLLHRAAIIIVIIKHFFRFKLVMILIHSCIPVLRWDTGTTLYDITVRRFFAVSHIGTHYYAASHWVAWSVSLSVALSVCQPCKNGWNDQVAICVPDLGVANEARIKWGPIANMGRDNFEGKQANHFKV